MDLGINYKTVTIVDKRGMGMEIGNEENVIAKIFQE